MKRCYKCKVEKSTAEFGKDKSRKDGFYPQCKGCQRATSRKWKERNPEKVKKTSREWTKRNPESNRKAAKAWAKRNPEKVRAYQRAHYARNKKKVATERKKRLQKDPEFYKKIKRKVHAKKCGIPEVLLDAVESAVMGLCWICGDYQGSRKYIHSIDHDHESGKFRGILCSQCNTALGLLRDNPKLCEVAAKYLRNPPGIEALTETAQTTPGQTL